MNRTEQFILDFADRSGTFSASALLEKMEPTLKTSRAVINSYLAQLANKGLISRTGRGCYSASGKKLTFLPKVSVKAQKLYKSLNADFPFAKLCLYQGSWITPLMHNIASNNMLYVEVERDAAEAVFEHLKSNNKKAFYRPDSTFFYRYIDIHDDDCILVKVLTTEAPLISSAETPVSSLEKIIVDIYTDGDFAYLQGSEYYAIVHNALDKYSVNKSKLLRYAARRNCRQELKQILEESINDIY